MSSNVTPPAPPALIEAFHRLIYEHDGNRRTYGDDYATVLAALAAPPPDAGPHCHAAQDGECSWTGCPQAGNRQPHCPLDTGHRWIAEAPPT